MKQYPTGVLRLGTTKSWARYLMPAYILAFKRRYPDVQIELADGTSEDMAFSVLHGHNDVAIVARMPFDAQLENMPFPAHERDQLVMVVHPKHRLARRKKVLLAELANEKLLLRGRGSGIREAVMQAASEQGLELDVVLEAGSAEFIKAMVAQGAGCSILTTLSVEEEERSGRLRSIPLSDPGLWLNIDLLVRRDGYRSNAVKAFLEFLSGWREAPAPAVKLTKGAQRKAEPSVSGLPAPDDGPPAPSPAGPSHAAGSSG